MSIEQSVNEALRNYPKLRRFTKRIYQTLRCSVSHNFTSEGNIKKLSPDDNSFDYFFGYYDKSPWDASGRYVLCLKAKNTWSNVAPKETADILLIDTENNSFRVLEKTHSWNVQQGCMLQWLGPDFNSNVIFNDFRNGKYCSVIINVFTGEQKELVSPVYSVSSDGSFALTVDFSRLHRLRPGYGYSNIDDVTVNEPLPDSACIWKLDIRTNQIIPVMEYKDFYNFEHKKEMENATHKVNHIMLSPDNSRFMILHRWFCDKKKYTRLITANIDGSNMYNLSDEGMVSHCCWKDNNSILAFAHKKNGGNGYYLMKDKTQEYERLWSFINFDGHPSYSPDGSCVLTDTYPNGKRIQTLRIMSDDASYVIGKVFAPFKYDNDTRCDLHPRWSRDGKKICFDACFEGCRGLYEIDISACNFSKKKDISSKLKSDGLNKKRIVYLMTSCRKTGPTQQTLNIIKNLDTSMYTPILVTIYEEEPTSRLADYLPYISEHYFCKLSKKQILLNKCNNLKNLLERIKPDLIHTVGVFPDYAVSKIKLYKHVFTLRNYIYDDYPALFGKIKGTILAKMQLYAIKKSDRVVACSQSLSRIYKEKLNINVSYIRNGVDTKKYKPSTENEKKLIRSKLGFPLDSYIFVCSGQIIERKNLSFLLEAFIKTFKDNDSVQLVLLGDGNERDKLEKLSSSSKNIRFVGNVTDVSYYLRACDCCVSTSKSEGLPNSVLEAMACGLPVILSDIEQHKELFSPNSNIGYLYSQGNIDDLCGCLVKMQTESNKNFGTEALTSVRDNFDSQLMSKNYQENVYKPIILS